METTKGHRTQMRPSKVQEKLLVRSCGAHNPDITPKDRVFHYPDPVCGLAMDRSLNAATDLCKLAASSAESPNGRRGGAKPALSGRYSPVKRQPKHSEASNATAVSWRFDYVLEDGHAKTDQAPG